MDIARLEHLAEGGDTAAALDIGHLYAEGEGVPQNLDKALDWWRLASKNGSAPAKMALGRHYENAKDGKQALAWYLQAAELGHWPALGAMRALFDARLADDDGRYEPILTRAAESGDVDSQFQLGVMMDMAVGEERDADGAFRWIKRAAENEHREAAALLSAFYTDGTGTPVNPAEAYRWALKAAEAGHSGAQVQVGGFLLEGVGTDPDPERAAGWLKKAAPASAPAQFLLSQYYLRQENDAHATQVGLAWLQQAADNGLPMAQYLLGQLYAVGKFVKKDWPEAVRWLSLASSNGLMEAHEFLDQESRQRGVVPASGKAAPPFDEASLPPDRRKVYQRLVASAIEGHPGDTYQLAIFLYLWQQETGQTTPALIWMQRAAELDNAEAQFNLGIMHLNGMLGPRDAAKGFEWWAKAAAQGHLQAATELGYGLACGVSGTLDVVRGVAYLREAAEKGFPEAQFLYGMCHLEGIGMTADPTVAVEWFKRAQHAQNHKASQMLGYIWSSQPDKVPPYRFHPTDDPGVGSHS